jgi:hypothetical protein
MKHALLLDENAGVWGLDLDEPDSLTVLQAAVKGNFQVIDLAPEVLDSAFPSWQRADPGGVSMWMNEEGKYQPGLERNLIATVVLRFAGGIPGDFVMGPVAFTGLPDDEGETQGLTLDQVIGLTGSFTNITGLAQKLVKFVEDGAQS